MKQGVLNTQPLSVSTLETILEQSIPFVGMPPSEPKRKSKRVKQQAIGPGKRQKTLLTIEFNEEEEEQEAKQIDQVTTAKQSTGKAWQPWKPNIEKLNVAISNEGNFVQMNKFYDFYSDIEK